MFYDAGSAVGEIESTLVCGETDWSMEGSHVAGQVGVRRVGVKWSE